MSEEDELLEDLAELALVHPGRKREGTLDQYREFRQVFLANDAGKRVLYDILSWCHFFTVDLMHGNAHLLFASEGKRAIAVKLMKTIREEPKARPMQQQRSKPKD